MGSAEMKGPGREDRVLDRGPRGAYGPSRGVLENILPHRSDNLAPSHARTPAGSTGRPGGPFQPVARRVLGLPRIGAAALVAVGLVMVLGGPVRHYPKHHKVRCTPTRCSPVFGGPDSGRPVLR